MTNDGINSYSWDARNQLSSLTKGRTTNSFQYDAYGRRTQKTVSGTSTGFLYDGANPVQELAGTTPMANMLTGLGVDQYLTRTDSAGTRDLLPDALGSTVALTDTTGTIQTSYTYEPFGNTTASGLASTNSYQFTGRENDGTGLDYYRARYYNPTFQRFVSEDQMGFAAGDPNLYGYAGSAPTDVRDPSGNFIQAVAAGCLIGATIAGFVDDIKLANAARKGRQGPTFGQFVGDIVKGCVTGAVIAAVAVMAEILGGWVLGDVAAEAGGARGLSDLGGIFSSETNAAGGTVWTSEGAISQNDVAGLVNSGMYRGEVNILTGVHGEASGATVVDRSFYEADVARFGNLPGVNVYNFPEMTASKITELLNGSGTTIGAFCDSGACLAPFR